jgi:adenylate kinase
MEDQIKIIKKWLGSGSVNLFGSPFAGKDTQGLIIAELLDAHLVAGGDILRSYPDQEKIKELMSTGNLFPTDLYMEIVLPFLSQTEFNGKPLLLSAVGRLHGEEQIISNATAESGHPIKAVINMELSESEVWRRFEESKKNNDRGNRADDQEDALKNRLLKFKAQTLPVIEFYRNKSLVIDINGNLSKEEVTSSIIKELSLFLSNT